LHIELAVAIPLVQLPVAQTVVAAHRRHAPLPSQKPSVPQLDWADAEQSLRGFVPGSAFLHVPRLLVALQTWQVPLHATLQQTLSTQ
jgi:hypothetical protein